MNRNIAHYSSKKKINSTILISPMDWGLGHATRCIPIIRILVDFGCTVIIASSGYQEQLLRLEFPDLEFIPLDGYGIRYARKHTMLRLLQQLPSFITTIKKEHRWLNEIVRKYKVDAIISDNRYGLYHRTVPAIIITHQLQVLPPVAAKILMPFLRTRIYSLIRRFSACWIPDLEEEIESMAGTLSHPATPPPFPVQYLGLLSRFQGQRMQMNKKYSLTISLSGPEPQRTLFEILLLKQLDQVPGKILLVRGKPGALDKLAVPQNVAVHNHLQGEQLKTVFLESEFVLCRSGYSSVMDLQVLACKSILVPTPGQTEQEYLGRRLLHMKAALVKPQKGFNLANSMAEARSFPFRQLPVSNSKLTEIVRQWLLDINQF